MEEAALELFGVAFRLRALRCFVAGHGDLEIPKPKKIT